MTIFLRLLDVGPDQKGAALTTVAERWRAGSEPEGLFQVEPSSFEQVPGSPFAYWVSERVRRLFTELSAFEGEERTVKVGLQTSNDFRFVRCWWEVDATAIGNKWFPFAKGGSYSPFYSDVQMVVNWGRYGSEVRNYCDPRTGRTYSRPQNTDFYFRPGLTWPLRGVVFSAQAVPAGCVFSVAGKMAFVSGNELPSSLALFNSTPFDAIVRLFAGKIGGVQYEVGLIGSVRYPGTHPKLDALGTAGWRVQRRIDQAAQRSHAFTLPALLQVSASTIEVSTSRWQATTAEAEARLSEILSEIDDITFTLYGLEAEDRRVMEQGYGNPGSSEAEDAEGEQEGAEEEGESSDPLALTEALVEWALGVSLGHFDVRFATAYRELPPDPDPFDPLPVCSPGMLQAADGLPATQAPDNYPLELPPHGVLVDDPGHPWDIVLRIETVLMLAVGERAHAWIGEAEGVLGRDLCDWLRRSAFDRHLKRYSRSNRKAPIFWYLAPKSRGYGIWLYSPAATRDTFFRIQNDYVDPKLKAAERRLIELRQQAGDSPTSQQRKELAAQESLVEDLRAFREQVGRIARLWRPFRDDGVVLNCAVLSSLFEHHRPWQKECAKKWDELAAGAYEWAGWAMHLWPARVVAACADDRSLAIAHGIEETLWRENEGGKWEPHPDSDEQVAKLTAERRSPALEAALAEFLKGM